MSEHPTAAALAGYAEGGEPQLAEHVDACPACREQTAAFQAVSNLLAAASPATRSSCPPRTR